MLIKRLLKEFICLVKDFGLVFAIKHFFYKKTHRYDKFISLIYSYMKTFLSDKIEEYNKLEKINNDGLPSKNIWVCWWQGYDNMPFFCAKCFQNLKDNTPDDYNIILITKDNYLEYVDIPSKVLEMLNNNLLSVTQFSDILRQALIYQNGGLWLDASIWVTSNYLERVETDLNFWSVKLSSVDDPRIYGQVISECKWNGFILYGKKNNVVCKFVFEAMCKYFENHNSIIDYFYQNLILKVAYENVAVIREEIDSVKESNQHLYELYRCMDEAYIDEKWCEMCNDTSFFKLTQKREYNSFNNNEKTFYGFLFD